ncbi:hypothetical protein [Chromobacterium amazonense]|uniref:hypothetical protein n=1 Tax=Chromobacterium amazonense TaxID=1382803 RepID=UPI0031F66D42
MNKMVVGLVAGITSMVIVVVTSIVLWTLDKLPWQNGAGSNQGNLVQNDSRYVPIDKIIVMLKRSDAEKGSFNYALVSLILKSTPDMEASTKNQLLNVQSVVLQALSIYTLDEIKMKSIKELTLIIEKALNDNYQKQNVAKPFTSVQLTKFIAE